MGIPQDINFENFKITDLIPQKEPFVMIDKIILSDGSKTKTKFNIKVNNIFSSNGVFTEPGLIENIAQTAAARIGFISKLQDNPVPLGFIGGIKNLSIFFLPHVNTILETEIIITNEILKATLIDGKIYNFGKLAASCEMKIFLM